MEFSKEKDLKEKMNARFNDPNRNIKHVVPATHGAGRLGEDRLMKMPGSREEKTFYKAVEGGTIKSKITALDAMADDRFIRELPGGVSGAPIHCGDGGKSWLHVIEEAKIFLGVQMDLPGVLRYEPKWPDEK